MLNRLVIFSIACAVLWTQFFGLSHSINHGWSANYLLSSITQQHSKDSATQPDALLDASDKSQSNSPITHNCLAWESCSLTTAVSISSPVQTVISLVFFLSSPDPLPKVRYKHPQYFLSRAPPLILSR